MNETKPEFPEHRAEVGDRRWQIVAAVSDLMFTAKISAAAKQAGCAVKFLQQQDQVVSALSEIGGQCAPLLIVDLNHASLNAVELVSKVKATAATANVPVLAYLSHTQINLKRAAEHAGCDLVLPRSIFSQNINEILRRHSCHLASLNTTG